MPETPLVLAIDLGTSGPKVALVGSDGAILGSEFEPVELVLYPGGGAEQDPEEWWRAVGAAARRTLGGTDLAAAVAGVAVTAQWSGTVAVDAAGGALGNAIIWMDSRGAPHIERLIGGIVTVEGYEPRKLRKWLARTGGAPARSGKDSIAHILYLRHERPEVYSKARRFLEPKDYLNFRLTGRAAATFDSIILHWVTDNRDPAAIAYDPELLDLAGLAPEVLPDLVAATDVLGDLTPAAATHLGLPGPVPVIGGTPDLHSAAIGAGSTADFAAHLYVGTSSWLICHVPFKKTDLFHSIASLPAAIPGRYIAANEQETAGKALEWIGDAFFPEAAGSSAMFAELNRLAAAVAPGSGGVLFTPWLFGERTPVEDATLRGGFFNQSLETGRAEMIRAVFEGVAFNSRWLLRYVERFTKRRLDPIVMVGGGARSALWCQIHADVLGRTVQQASEPLMVNVRGAGLLGHVALGNIRWQDVPRLVPIAATYRPTPAHSPIYDRLFDGFVRIYKANHRTYRRLNRR